MFNHVTSIYHFVCFKTFQDRCRTFSCPWNSVVFYGSCLKFSNAMSNVVLPVTLLFRPANSDKSLGDLVTYSGNAEAKIASNLRERFGFEDCDFQELGVSVFINKAHDRTLFLLIDLKARVTEECSFDFIVNNTRKLAAQSHTMFVSTTEDAIPMIGYMHFADMFDAFDKSLYDKEVIAFKTDGLVIPASVTGLYICPHLKLNLSEYNSLMTKLGQQSVTREDIGLTSLVYNGFYVLYDDVIAVCVDTYFNLRVKKGIDGVNCTADRYLYMISKYSYLTCILFIFHCLCVRQMFQF